MVISNETRESILSKKPQVSCGGLLKTQLWHTRVISQLVACKSVTVEYTTRQFTDKPILGQSILELSAHRLDNSWTWQFAE